tara:strand:- start:340 stop:906 length:567 start_codon:yes stop_codon:yes gene_type:complete
LIKKSSLILIFISLLLFNKILYANERQRIIENLNSIETLKFKFNQISFDKKETGDCFLKRPHFLKCIYQDDKQKQLIVNKNSLIVYHARYNKSYFYPIKASYFLDILDKKRFENLILSGSLKENNDYLQILYLDENKGEIKFLFDLNNFDLKGWEIIGLNGNKTTFKLNNIFKNQKIDEKLFKIPSSS